MEKEADLGFQQDADTAYNTMFFSPAANYDPENPFQFGNFGGDQRYGVIWPGPNTTITFANGSSSVIPTMAKVVGNLTGIGKLPVKGIFPKKGSFVFRDMCFKEKGT